jgi:hypothetical protein
LADSDGPGGGLHRAVHGAANRDTPTGGGHVTGDTSRVGDDDRTRERSEVTVNGPANDDGPSKRLESVDGLVSVDHDGPTALRGLCSRNTDGPREDDGDGKSDQ